MSKTFNYKLGTINNESILLNPKLILCCWPINVKTTVLLVCLKLPTKVNESSECGVFPAFNLRGRHGSYVLLQQFQRYLDSQIFH